MSAKERRKIESLMALHAAPTLMGIKCGSLPAFNAKEYDLHEVERLFADGYFGSRINARSVTRSSGRMLVYVYDTVLLEKTLSDRDIRDFLAGCGYADSWDTVQCIDRLCSRLGEKDFPHEIGIFLGYPLEDVKGFIANCGQGCKLCGTWKVYGDVEKAKEMFERFENCRLHLCRELRNGKKLRNCAADVTAVA